MKKKKPANPAALYLSRWPSSHDTHKTMLSALKRACEALGGDDPLTFAWADFDYEDAVSLPALLQEGARPLASASINKILVAVRGVLEAAWRSGQMTDEQYRRIEFKRVIGTPEKAGRALSSAEIDALLAALSSLSTRDAAIIAIMYGCGIRKVEFERLTRDSYSRDERSLSVRGKRNKVREIPIPEDVWRYVDAYWDALPTDRAFDMTRREIALVVERFCREVKLPTFTPHDLRRTYATVLLDKGVDIATVAGLMGHSSIEVTRIYDRRGRSAQVAAVKLLNRRTDGPEG